MRPALLNEPSQKSGGSNLQFSIESTPKTLKWAARTAVLKQRYLLDLHCISRRQGHFLRPACLQFPAVLLGGPLFFSLRFDLVDIVGDLDALGGVPQVLQQVPLLTPGNADVLHLPGSTVIQLLVDDLQFAAIGTLRPLKCKRFPARTVSADAVL